MLDAGQDEEFEGPVGDGRVGGDGGVGGPLPGVPLPPPALPRGLREGEGAGGALHSVLRYLQVFKWGVGALEKGETGRLAIQHLSHI